jgi:2-polyprenyl-6-methoxyphenol hydroxylase-like FAD-dependent oxidoreductase
MSTPRPAPGRVAVLGAGPAGMAAALGILKAGHEVVLYERYREARPAGNILNLWPPPLKALRALGVDISDFGAPTDSEFRSISGRVRVRVKIDPDVKRAYGGGFIGLLRPELYARMLAAIPPGCIRFGQQVERIEQNESVVLLHFAELAPAPAAASRFLLLSSLGRRPEELIPRSG